MVSQSSARGRRCGTVILAALLALLAGCRPLGAAPDGPALRGSAAVAVPVGKSTRTTTVDGVERTFHLYRPATLASPAALVVMLHGGFGTGVQAESSYGWDAEADAGHFLVAYPDGLDRAWAVGGGCCGTPGRTGVNDVTFLTQLVSAVSAGVPVDPARVYATGISNGGLMAYRLACDTTVFAAIGPDSATLLGTCSSPAPVSVIHIHGTADHNIPYAGGQGDGPARINGPAVADVVAMWRGVDHCGGPTATTAAPVTISVDACPDGRAVELVTIDGAGHQWPGGAPKSRVQQLLGTDPVSTALNATDTIWRFFAAHPAPGVRP